ncbi:hypothetical protein BJ875DRAFT_424802 [Amylocarpus encephaloides]|uniref:Uncharacterized protein n=1 Tax=Amylocarpus encephaloides TaxID=45428 RepID=A0A9P7YI15_9HELO|nr:hypothetical protein BJ875DRAFT_424802 [Amylocarpus encephaloides]
MMKCLFTMVALATAATATEKHEYPPLAVTSTVMTTTTVCPITSTYMENGSTKVVTTLTTSTLTITSCPGGQCGGATTLPRSPTTSMTSTGVTTTYTTVCPVTETKIVVGSTYYETYTTTSTFVTAVISTVQATATSPPITEQTGTTNYITSTSLCPVTETETVEGSTVTKIWTSTSLIITHIPKVIKSFETAPPATTTVGTLVLSTSTSICPYTTVETISGLPVTITSSSFSLIFTHVPQTQYSKTTVVPPPTTVETYVLSTSTSYCPVTEIQTISGSALTVINTITSLIEVKVPTTIASYTTLLSTNYLTSNVYQATTCIESFYITVSAASTMTIPTTITNIIKITDKYTVTSTYGVPTTAATVVVPITRATSIPTTKIVTIPSEQTYTQPSTIVNTIPVITESTYTGPPATAPSNFTTTAPPAPPLQSANVAVGPNRPISLALAGAMAVLALV